jgi:hypothetical protein
MILGLAMPTNVFATENIACVPLIFWFENDRCIPTVENLI